MIYSTAEQASRFKIVFRSRYSRLALVLVNSPRANVVTASINFDRSRIKVGKIAASDFDEADFDSVLKFTMGQSSRGKTAQLVSSSDSPGNSEKKKTF